MSDFKNNFSWSKSRDGCFKECEKKYYYNHYGFWNGWMNWSHEKTKRIYYLKKLAIKEIWIGQVVHEIIEWVLKKYRFGEHIGLSHAMAVLRKRLDTEYIVSKIKEYSGFSSKTTRLFEHEYEIEIDSYDKQKMFEYAGQCLLNFYNSDAFMEIRRTPVEDWILLEDFLKFDFEGSTVFLSVDFAMRKGDKIIMYDWKTGKERIADFDMQLMLYSLYVQEKFNTEPENIVAKVFNLSIDKVDDFLVDKSKLENAKNYMRESIQRMKGKLLNIEQNIARESDFEKVHPDDEITKYPCSRCNYKKICKGEWKEIAEND
jgi:radical SAM protein with 4Fe4S-binding SPASM domain